MNHNIQEIHMARSTISTLPWNFTCLQVPSLYFLQCGISSLILDTVLCFLPTAWPCLHSLLQTQLNLILMSWLSLSSLLKLSVFSWFHHPLVLQLPPTGSIHRRYSLIFILFEQWLVKDNIKITASLKAELAFFFPHISSTKLKPLLWIKCMVILMDFHSQLLCVCVEDWL